MTSFILDTLAYSETLKAGGFSEQQAATQARALAEILDRRIDEGCEADLARSAGSSSLSDLQRKNLIIEDKKFAPKKLKLFNFNRLPHQVRQAARVAPERQARHRLTWPPSCGTARERRDPALERCTPSCDRERRPWC
ncbi:hypothetical protein [uncultured Lamprocystis sp.]|jgi:hypothetical protein|uniref:hypothetical protein n=1 Tax=uncultured Lamprocystis sp. TaxID=543132 RepID=UPI0025EFFADA|nr:hypothetical protein [uncultured Lamprocystis sp.]